MCRGEPKAESCEVSDHHDPEGSGLRSPSETVLPGGTVPVGLPIPAAACWRTAANPLGWLVLSVVP